MSEIKVQKRLTWLGLASLVSIPVTGPIGVLGAATIFSGKLLRLSWNDEARKNYEIEKKYVKENQNIATKPNTSNYPHSMLDESPETAIARRTPLSAKKLLDRDSKRNNYVLGLREGAKLVEGYLQRLPQEEYSKIKKINIYPEQQTKVFGIPFGRKSLETKIIK